MANKRVIKNEAWFVPALATSLLYQDGVVYGTDEAGNTYKAEGNQWVLVTGIVRTESPAGWTVPTNGIDLVDSNHEVWSIQVGTRLVLKAGVSLGVTASSLTYTNRVVKRIGLDNHRYAWTGSAWTDEGSIVPVLVESPEGTAVPPSSQLIDASLKVWTRQTGTNLVFREGISLGVTASVIRIVGHVVKRDGLDNHRYSWNNTTSAWVDDGLIIPVILGSANGTRGKTVVDRFGDTWTIDLSNNVVFKNDVGTNAWASVLLMANDVLTHKGTGIRIYMKETGRGTDIYIPWNSPGNGQADPFTGAPWATRSVNGTRGGTVVFPDGQTWTRGSSTSEGFQVLREGLPMPGASVVDYKIWDDRLYRIDSLSNWWQFGGLQDGSGGVNSWSFFGTTDPERPIIPPPPPGGALRYVVTTGNIASGSYRLLSVPTAAYNTLAEGDYVIVETTTGMGRGTTRGPGGSYPQVSVANAGALPSASAQSWLRMIWTENDGHVYQVIDTNGDGSGTKFWFYMGDRGIINRYLESLVIPRSIHARIRAKSAGEIHLEDFDGNLISCQATMTGANVYLNVIPALKAIIDALPPGTAGYQMPAGQYPGSAVLWIDRPNFTLQGAGIDSTYFFTPRGVIPVGVAPMPGVNGGQFFDFGIGSNNYPDSNHDPDWYGLNWSDTPTLPWPTFGTFLGVNDFSGIVARQVSTMPQGLTGYQNQNVLVQRVRVDGHTSNAFGSSFCSNWVTRNSKANYDCNTYDYLGWTYGHYDSENCGMEDCDLVAYSATTGCEQFKSTGGFFRRLNLTNMDFSLNNAGGWLIEDCTQTYTTDCCVPNSYHSPRQPCLASVTAIGSTFASLAGTIRRHTIRQLGYVRGGCVTKVGINVGHDTPNIRIEGAYHSAPDYNAAVETFPVDADGSSVGYPSGSRGLEAAGQNCLVGGMAVDGLSPQHYYQAQANFANIYNRGGFILNGFGANRGDPRTLAKWGSESAFYFNTWP